MTYVGPYIFVNNAKLVTITCVNVKTKYSLGSVGFLKVILTENCIMYADSEVILRMLTMWSTSSFRAAGPYLLLPLPRNLQYFQISLKYCTISGTKNCS